MCIQDFKSCKSYCGIIAGIILAIALFWFNDNVSWKRNSQLNTITVSGSGEVFVKPDLAQTSFSVISEAKTVAEALTDNTQKMNAVISFIKSQEVGEKDLKTTNFSIYPRYDYIKEKRMSAGYEVQQSLQV